jgi:5-methyltetrahydropteroyltriglutamate--homocysteine methyltransferase
VHVHDYFGEPRGGALVEGNDIIESPKLIRDRILYASKLLKDPSRISVNPDCGLRTRSWEIAYRKLQALSEGAKLARQELSK